MIKNVRNCSFGTLPARPGALSGAGDDSAASINTSDTVEISSSDKASQKGGAPMRVREQYDLLHDGMEFAHIGSELAGSLGATGLMGFAATAGASVAGVFFGYEGVKDLAHAVKHRDIKGGFESLGHIGLAGDSLIRTAGEVAGLSAVSSFIGPAASAVMSSPLIGIAGMGLGTMHGAVETVLGGKALIEGIKAKDNKKIIAGALETGIGVAATAAALGGGPVATVALTGLFMARLGVVKNKEIRHAAGKLAGAAKKFMFAEAESGRNNPKFIAYNPAQP